MTFGEPTIARGSAARYIATSIMEVSRCPGYDQGQITILEIMGRNAGWLTASSALAADAGCGPDLIYLPELPFDLDKFIAEVNDLYQKQKNVIVAVSEGIKDKDGRYISEYGQDLAYTDSFGHVQLGGLASTLVNILKQKIDAKIRGIEFSLCKDARTPWFPYRCG